MITRRKRLFPAGLGAVLVVVLLGGCGGSSQVEPATYVHSVCTALGNWKNTIQSAGVALESSGATNASRPVAKEDYREFVSALATATGRATGALRSAGVPQVARGQQIAGQLTQAFARATQRLAKASVAAQSIPTDSATTFQAGASSVTNQIKSALQGLSAVAPGGSPELRSAAAGEPACQVLQG
jgi:hypothetical protein